MEIRPCPFCGGELDIYICDDEGNIRDEEYELEPWSGLSFAIKHVVEYNDECPIANYETDDMGLGVYLYDSREELIEKWNTRK